MNLCNPYLIGGGGVLPMSAATRQDKKDEGLHWVSDGHRVVNTSITTSGMPQISWTSGEAFGPKILTIHLREREREQEEREKIHQPDLARRKPMKQKTKPQMALKNLQMLQDHRL